MSDLDEFDEAALDDACDDWAHYDEDELSDDERERAFEMLHGPQPDEDPLDDYAKPVTRVRKPDAAGRDMHDVLPTL
ncbi:hypothetical protein ABZ330_21645 [Streptomyces sp. NPDC006172]|uniref:hypothetical protein n=1 Tax=Streptomyces sp. NPDC006172 TaxID=3154470 RepID=UPI0033FBB92C